MDLGPVDHLKEGDRKKYMGGNAPTQEGQLKKALSALNNISHKDSLMNIFSMYFLNIITKLIE